jgi:hypothetical protein
VRKGERLLLEASHDDHHLSTLRILNVRQEHIAGQTVGHAQLIGLPQAQSSCVGLQYEGGHSWG